MATYVAQTQYGYGHETTTGTAVAITAGIPQEGLITFNMGDEFENTPKMQGKPYAVTNEYVNIGKMPGATGWNHNIYPVLLHRLLASMHASAGAESANVFTITPGTDPAAGATYTYGETPSPCYALTVKHQSGATGSVNHVLSGCVCTSLTLTFPAGGGPAKMSYDLTAMDSDDAVASAGTYTLESTAVDAIASGFTYELGVYGAAATVYPAGDVTITFAPEVEIMKQGEDKPYKIHLHRWGGTFSVTKPWDAAGDVDDLYTAYASGQHFNLKVWNDETPDALGELLFDVRGRALSPATLGGEGVITETAEFTMCGSTAVPPYVIKYFDTVIA